MIEQAYETRIFTLIAILGANMLHQYSSLADADFVFGLTPHRVSHLVAWTFRVFRLYGWYFRSHGDFSMPQGLRNNRLLLAQSTSNRETSL